MECRRCQRNFNSPRGECPFCGTVAATVAGDAESSSVERDRIDERPSYMRGTSQSEVMYIPAGFWRRVLAALVDGWIVWLLQVVLFTGFFIVGGGSLYLLGGGSSQSSTALSVALMVIAGILLVLFATLSYYVVFEWSRFAATPGKMLLGLSVTDLEGNQISLRRSVGRQAGKLLSSLLLCIGYLMAAFTERKQALHDKLAGCLVVYDPRTPAWRIFLALFIAIVPFCSPSMVPSTLIQKISKTTGSKNFDYSMPQSDPIKYRSIRPNEEEKKEEIVATLDPNAGKTSPYDLAPSPNFASIADLTVNFQTVVAFYTEGVDIIEIGLYGGKLSDIEVGDLKRRGDFGKTSPDLKVTVRFGEKNTTCDSSEISSYVVSFESKSPIFGKTVKKDVLEFARTMGASRSDEIGLNCERKEGSTFSAVIRGDGIRRNALDEEKATWNLAFQTTLFKKKR